MPTLTIIGTERGGDGKSTLTILLAEMHRAATVDLIVLDADDAGRLESGKASSRLGEVLPHHEVVLLGAGPSDAAVQADPDTLSEFWDKLGHVARTRKTIVDMGANTIQRFTRYGAEMNIDRRWRSRGIEIEAFVPTCNSDDSFSKAIKTLNALRAALPSAQIHCVLNARDGGFAHWHETQDWAELKRLERAGVRLLDLPRCDAPAAAWAALEREKLSFFEAAEMSEDELAERLGLSEDVTARAQIRITRWLNTCYSAWAGAVPERPE